MKFLVLTGVFVIGVCIFSGVVTFLQGNQQSGCALDGSEIQPLYEVVKCVIKERNTVRPDLETESGEKRAFFLKRYAPPTVGDRLK
ncbi:MAG: hypothetical protein J7L16_07610, partial [Deltaproteobacteria bacterium]|nr:hypothetical protein [Deltaproteobacteria bacterium]